MKNKLVISMLTVSMALSLAACGDSVSSTSVSVSEETSVSETVTSASETEASTEEPVSSIEEKTETSAEENSAVDLKYNYIVNSSIQSTGNNLRIKKVLEKARSGETVNMALLGGSITEGAGADSFHEGYAYIFADAFKETYCSGDNLNYVNAGLSGTPSPLGAMRYQKDVIDQLGTYPDLLVIEFAVNDYNEATNGRALESLIYQALTDNEDCAVILLFSLSEGKWSMATQMAPTGFYYSIPMVNMVRCFDTGMVNSDDYFWDEYHPAPYGHQLTSDCLMRLLEQIDEEEIEEEFEIPAEAKLGRDFTNMKLATAANDEVTIETGSFGTIDTEVQKSAFKNVISFTDNFKHKADDANDSLKFTLSASHVLLNYKTSNSKSYGEADVYVDGTKVMTLNGYSSAGWDNCNAALVLDESSAAKHTVEIKMAPGSEDKNFTLLALAYN